LDIFQVPTHDLPFRCRSRILATVDVWEETDATPVEALEFGNIDILRLVAETHPRLEF